MFDFEDIIEDVAGLGGAFIGGGIGSKAGATIAADLSDGDKTITTIGGVAGGLLGAVAGMDFIEAIFDDED